ncbi:NADH dehydrogenase, FAD-containing subunit [Desulfocicer vacuolatum DSM 3385]|uniref:NADH dehydrogenase, FAD-containing subunit n=1 Tax=Desulfocicer vacuolatum DSM 3385 TaxID=1121400 RepID=A0A1W2DGC8_9BACT|nr:FAD-dependent oxidoreductase [Desulfocicer vacuolatum]SMC96569.1 NADH dehydrogenase, FAD-containing subunit [Desulfocicer vacuolatum DSM 3385]
MEKTLILVGGGHAHMETLAHLEDFVQKGFKVIVVGPSTHHYYSGMGPGMLGKTYTPKEIRFATRHVVEKKGAIFIEDKGVRIDPDTRTLFLASGKSLSYDVISFNAGSYVPQESVMGDDNDVYPVKPIEKLMEAQARIEELTRQKKIAIAIVGGGPSSAEIAGNVRQLTRGSGFNTPDITIFAGNKFMGRFPEKVRQGVMTILQKRDIILNESGYVSQVKDKKVTLKSGETFSADFIFMALGVKPSTIFEQSGLPTGPDGGLLVNKYLQSTRYPEIFGGGDCIYFQDAPLDKVGVYAVRENPILLHNIMACLTGNPLKVFAPGGDYLLIFNLGDGLGVLKKRGIFLKGRLAFKLKDYIDRKFMKLFQAIE